MNIQIMLTNLFLITSVSKKSWKIFLSEFTQALDTNACTKKIVCNTCELIKSSDDILNAGGIFEDKHYYGFTGSIFKKPSININNNTKMKLMKIKRTPKPNIY